MLDSTTYVKSTNLNYGIFPMLGILILCGFLSVPSFSQEFTQAVTVTTDKKSYVDGDTIIISGTVRERLSGYDVNVQVIAANGNLVTRLQLPVLDDNTFGIDLAAGGPLWRSAGTYTTKVLYGTATRTAETTFYFSGSGDVIPGPKGKTFQLARPYDGFIGYSIKGGNILNIVPNQQAKSLTIAIETTSDGRITLILPRNIIDSRSGIDGKSGEDDYFLVLLDGAQVDYEETTTAEDRTLTIPFEGGNTSIEITGTTVTNEQSSEIPSDEEILVASTEDGSLYVVITPTRISGQQNLSFELSFEDEDDNPIEHVNFDVSATQGNREVLAETQQHTHGGTMEFATAPLISDNPLNVQVVILGIGLPNDDPATWTGSKGETLALILVDFTISDESDEEPPQTDLPYSADVSIPAGSSTTDCMDTNQCYIPADVAIASGGEVVWSNDDNASHTVTSGHPTDGSDGNFDSGLFLPGQTFVHIFDQEGEYPYFCLVHPWMTGTVFVGQSIPNPTPTPTQPPQNLPSEATVLMAKGTASNTNCGDQCYMPNIVSVSAGGTVTWNNVDSAAHTATATDGSFDTSLVNAGASASHTFRNVGTYPYMCILHPWMKGTVIVGQGTPNPTPTPDIELFVDVDKPEYDLGELATLIIHISDVSSPQTVALTVTDPFGTIVVSRTLTTDSEGDASADFKIAESFKTGTYRIDATSLIDGWTYLDDSEFEVISQFNQIQIISAQGTDQQGNPMEFSRGSMGFVKVQVNAQKPIATLITVNVFDSDLTPLGVGSLKTTLNTGQSELILSFMIPEDAVVGTADIYVNALSDWVSAGGIPQTGEFAGQVRIN